MRKKILIFAIFPVYASSVLAQLNANQIYKTTSEYTVSIEVEHHDNSVSTGTGFFMKEYDAIVTNYHVIKNNSKIKIKYFNKKYYQGNITVNIDSVNDIALLRLSNSNSDEGLSQNVEDYNIGQKIFVIGNPLGLNYTVTEGIISSIRNYNKSEVIQFTAPVSPGSSGSPVLDENGQVIGIVTFNFKEGQNLNFAIPIKYAGILNSKYSLKEIKNIDNSINTYLDLSPNILIRLADSLYDKRNWKANNVMHVIISRPDITDSTLLNLTLKSLSHVFLSNMERNFLHSHSNNFAFINGRSFSTEDVYILIHKCLKLLDVYKYENTLISKFYLTLGYFLLKKQYCIDAYQSFKMAVDFNNSSYLALNGMSDFYRDYTKEVSKTNDSNYVCKERKYYYAEPDSVKFYLDKIVKLNPPFYDGYLKLIEFHLDRKTSRWYNQDLAFAYFTKCIKIEPENSLALKTFIEKLFKSNAGIKNFPAYNKAEELFIKYSSQFVYKNGKSSLAGFIAQNFSDIVLKNNGEWRMET